MDEQNKIEMLNLLGRILVNIHTVLNLNDDGKSYYCHNKIVGVMDQLNVLGTLIQKLPPKEITQPHLD